MFRFGICNELFVDWELPAVCETAKRLGYEGLELAPFTLAPRITDLSPDRMREIRQTIEDAGLETIGLHWLLAKTEGLHLTSPDAAIRRRTADYLKALTEATRELGGSLMVFGSPQQRNRTPEVTMDQAMDHAAEVFGAILDRLDSYEVDLCVEPLAAAETNFLSRIAEAEALIRRLDHPRVKLHLDTKAMSADPGGSIEDLIRAHGASAGHFHANDPNLRGPGMGDLDFGPIMKALEASGYDGWVSVEVFDYEPGAEATASQSIETLKRTSGQTA